jgi:hypothetical protein
MLQIRIYQIIHMLLETGQQILVSQKSREVFLDVYIKNGGEMVVPVICHQTKY